jgi:hypothetical protein
VISSDAPIDARHCEEIALQVKLGALRILGGEKICKSDMYTGISVNQEAIF